MNAHPAYTDADVQAASTEIQVSVACKQDFERSARAVLDAVAPAIAARTLREMAERTIAETVCCDEYERTVGGLEPRPRVPHHICYWGAAHAKALRERADEIEAGR